MKEIKVSVNSWYVVEGTAGSTVTNPSTNRVIATIEDGKQASFYATTPYVLASDDSVSVYKSTFNSAPAKLRLLGLLGGGETAPEGALPDGYIPALFITSLAPFYVPIVDNGNGYPGLEIEHDISFFENIRILYGIGGSVSEYWGITNSTQYELGHAYKLNVDSTFPRRKIIFKRQKGVAYLFVDGKTLVRQQVGLSSSLTYSYFGIDNTGGSRLYASKIIENGEVTRVLSMAVDPHGQPCLFDEVKQLPYYKSDNRGVVVGFTLEQAYKLADLPATGGSLTVSLPTGYESDAGVMAALETARSNGWTLTIQTYTPEAAAASSPFALRRIWVRRMADENGMYIDADGSRWQVDWCVAMLTPDGSTPTEHGYELFRSVEAAVAYWELTPWVDPEAEERLTEYNANE